MSITKIGDVVQFRTPSGVIQTAIVCSTHEELAARGPGFTGILVEPFLAAEINRLLAAAEAGFTPGGVGDVFGWDAQLVTPPLVRILTKEES